MDSSNKPTPSQTSPTSTLLTFLALYLTTLFSLDTWSAARNSPYRAPSTVTHFRPAQSPPAPDSYQGQMGTLGGNGGGNGGTGGRDVGRVGGARDSRPPLRMGGTASCGACAI